jgi:hypothetical protein
MLACAVGAGCHGVPDSALTQLIEARRVAADLHVQFLKASDASDRAVLADTDGASVAFARQAELSIRSVQAGLGELGTRLQSLGYHEEAGALDEFSRRFDEYRKLDHDVLALAVENTNLKAQRLSFGPVREAGDAFRDALDATANAAPAKERCRAEAAASRAILAVREIQILQAPHIAEENDAAMNKLEKEMAAREAMARDALGALAAAGGAAATAPLATATTALGRFEKLSSEVVALSRRNTNVRSLALSLRQKPGLTAACDGSLVALEQDLAKRGFGATR